LLVLLGHLGVDRRRIMRLMGAVVSVPADSADDSPQSAFRVQVEMY